MPQAGLQFIIQARRAESSQQFSCFSLPGAGGLAVSFSALQNAHLTDFRSPLLTAASLPSSSVSPKLALCMLLTLPLMPRPCPPPPPRHFPNFTPCICPTDSRCPLAHPVHSTSWSCRWLPSSLQRQLVSVVMPLSPHSPEQVLCARAILPTETGRQARSWPRRLALCRGGGLGKYISQPTGDVRGQVPHGNKTDSAASRRH